MNQDAVLKLKPGRELDIKVALEVMGYIWLKYLLQFSAELAVKWLGTTADIQESGGIYTAVKEEEFIALKEREGYAEAVPAFSTELASAEQVVGRMKELGYDYSLESELQAGSTVYFARFTKIADNTETAAGGGATVPEAICKAALQNSGCR